jgi:Niemann-Pick C2 protein
MSYISCLLLAAVGSQTLTGKVYWVNQMGDIPFVGMNSDGCTFTTCPIQADTRQTYEYQLSISKKFPVVSRKVVVPL